MHDRILKKGLLSNPFVGFKVSDREGRIMQSNAYFRNILGYEESELAAMTVADLCHSDDKQLELSERRQLMEGDLDHLTYRKRYLAKSGKTIWGDTSITAVRDANGGCEALVAMMVNVTAQRRQELLQQGQARVLELLYKNHSLKDVCTAIVESIELVEEGLLCSILQLNPISGTLHNIAAPSLPDFYNNAIDGMQTGDMIGPCGAAAFYGRPVVIADILNHPDWARVRRLVERTSLRSCWTQPILANDGKVLGTLALYCTEPREPGPFEIELINSAAELTALAINHNQALSVLQKNDRLKSEFISTAAHEMITPLSSIMGYAELLRQAHDLGFSQPDNRDKFLDVIIEKSELLSRIIDDLLDLSKIENGYCLELQKKPATIRKTMSKVVEHFERNAKQHVFSLITDANVPETVVIDEGRIVQVLENLLSNAVKYSPGGGLVELRAEAKPDKLHISVIDRGIGMSECQLERIFDKFYRANVNNPAFQGLGLGMSIVKEIVETHGGDIKVESALGEGTLVHVTVPYS